MVGAQAADINIAAYGALGDGTTDNRVVIQHAFNDAASAGVGVYIPPGTFAYRGALSGNGIRIYGAGIASVLHGLDPQNAGLRMTGNGPKVEHLKLTVVPPTARGASLNAQRVSFDHASNFLVNNIVIDGSGAGGIYMGYSTNGTIANNTISNTRADSIHMTHGTSYVNVANNRVDKSGDDGVAVVSYKNASNLIVHHITARDNVITNNVGGRGMSIVGGRDVLYENNTIENVAPGACILIAQERNYNTYSAMNSVIRYNTTKNCGSSITGHGGILVVGGGPEYNDNVRFVRNRIIQDTQRPGIRVITAFNRNLVMDSNKMEGFAAYSIAYPNQVTITPYSSGRVGYITPVRQILQSTPSAAVASPGASLPLTYNWQSGPLSQNLTVFVHVTDANGNVVLQDDHLPPTPTTQWNGNVSYTRTIALPATLVRARYTIHAGLYDPLTGARMTLTPGTNVAGEGIQRYQIGTLLIQGTEVSQAAPAALSAVPGGSLSVAYNWQSGPMSQNFAAFVHFVNAAGTIVFQDDHVPPASTTQWNGNVSYTRTVRLPANLAKQAYGIRIGLYNTVTGARQTLIPGAGVSNDGTLRYQVGTVTVR